MSYNFSDTALVPFLSSGLCTRPFHTPVLGASRRKAKEGTKQHVSSLCSFPPSGPYPSRTFCIAFVPLFSCLTFCARCLHTNPFLSHPLFLGQSSVLSLSDCRLELCFLRKVPLYPLFSPTHLLFVHSYSFVSIAVSRGPNCFWAKNRPCQSKTPKGALLPQITP